MKRLGAPPAGFVELPVALPGADPAALATAVVELERPDGARLRLHYGAGQSPRLAELLRAFLEPPGC